MTTFSSLTPATIGRYLTSRRALCGVIDASAIVDVREIGDGNLNLVFIVRDAHGGSVVLKQSLPHVRTDPTWPMTRLRSAREAAVLTRHQAIDQAHVPALYDYDETEFVLALEDLSDHAVWRAELAAGHLHPNAAAELGRYAARIAFATSPIGLDPAAHKALVGASINPELCQITEELVFTEPYIDHPHNAVLAANSCDVEALRADRDLLHEIGRAKYRFMTVAESLIHGDLHTGSVFVRPATTGHPASVRAFDSEFGFVGPTGFDLGVLWANLVIAAARHAALADHARADAIMHMPAVLISSFESEYTALWPARGEQRLCGDAALAEVLAGIRADAAVFAGAECIRRIVGFAKASDIESLPEAARARAARAVLTVGRMLAVSRLTELDTGRLMTRTAQVLKTAADR